MLTVLSDTCFQKFPDLVTSLFASIVSSKVTMCNADDRRAHIQGGLETPIGVMAEMDISEGNKNIQMHAAILKALMMRKTRHWFRMRQHRCRRKL